MIFKSASAKDLFPRNKGTSSQSAPEINLIPFIDVLLVVLIFLMISTTFTKYQELSITLPTAEGAMAKSKPKDVYVAISSDGRVAIDGKRVSQEQMSQALENAAGHSNSSENSPSIIIAADGKASHQAVMLVMEAARNANLPNVVFATQSTSK